MSTKSPNKEAFSISEHEEEKQAKKEKWGPIRKVGIKEYESRKESTRELQPRK